MSHVSVSYVSVFVIGADSLGRDKAYVLKNKRQEKNQGLGNYQTPGHVLTDILGPRQLKPL